MLRAGKLLVIPLVAAALSLSSCAESPSAPTASPTTTEAATVVPSPTPSKSLPEVTPEPSDSVDRETFDDVDGVRTTDLADMPETLLGLNQISSRAEVEQHRALVDYADADDTLRLGFAAYFLEIAERGYVHVFDTDDEHYQTSYRDSVEQLESDGRLVVESEHSHGPIVWDCAQTSPVEDFDRDMAVCRSVLYGRVISVTVVALTESPGASPAPELNDYLGEISKALEVIGG